MVTSALIGQASVVVLTLVARVFGLQCVVQIFKRLGVDGCDPLCVSVIKQIAAQTEPVRDPFLQSERRGVVRGVLIWAHERHCTVSRSIKPNSTLDRAF